MDFERCDMVISKGFSARSCCRSPQAWHDDGGQGIEFRKTKKNVDAAWVSK